MFEMKTLKGSTDPLSQVERLHKGSQDKRLAQSRGQLMDMRRGILNGVCREPEHLMTATQPDLTAWLNEWAGKISVDQETAHVD